MEEEEEEPEDPWATQQEARRSNKLGLTKLKKGGNIDTVRARERERERENKRKRRWP